jgi:hypothetical protein
MAEVTEITEKPELDPTLKPVELTLGDKTYQLLFTFEGLAIAKAKLRALKPPIEMNLLRSLDFNKLDVDTMPGVLFGALQQFQPDAEWSEIRTAITIRNSSDVYAALAEAYVNSMGGAPETAKADPPPDQS